MTKIDARVRRALLGLSTVVALAAGSYHAAAADLALAPKPMAYSWTGFYVGGNAGYGWSKQSNSLGIADGATIANCHFCDAFVPGTDGALAAAAGSSRFDPSGFVGGGQFGYNWQSANWVFGGEIDVEAFQQHQTITSSVTLPANTALGGVCGPVGASTCVGNFSNALKTDWLVTIRPRIGYTWDRTLIYGTGGLAITKISFSQTYSDNLAYLTGIGGTESASASSTKAGFVIGAGLEQAIGDNWSLKAEYLYLRFGGISANGVLRDGVPDTANFSNSLGHLSSNVVRVGVNYRFAPAIAQGR